MDSKYPVTPDLKTVIPNEYSLSEDGIYFLGGKEAPNEEFL